MSKFFIHLHVGEVSLLKLRKQKYGSTPNQICNTGVRVNNVSSQAVFTSE